MKSQMHFKSLELIGFKSFADKTRFEFEPGVTAIVGPNGCGKSNIADAIRWVLGEQSARLLRGLKMEDVIFNGTEQRKPLGLAEVSLTLAGTDECLPVDYREVTVTRRVFRSGEGQYFINKNPCRLKDINQLFMGTGIGLSAYSIIEQGKIELILSSKPEDRRFIFEEAAGITKYKEKKREALRKLDSTEKNLVRLSDIIKEVKRQLSSVERQAQRARRAKEVGDRLKELEIQSGAKKLSKIDRKVDDIERAHAEAKRGETEVRRRIEELEGEQESLRNRLYALDREIGTVHAKRMGVAGSIESNRNRIEANERLIHELEESEEQYGKEIEGMERTLDGLRSEFELLERTLSVAGGEMEGKNSELDRAVRALEDIRKSMREGESEAQRLRVELVEVINSTARLKNELGTLKNDARNAALRATRLQVESREFTGKLEALRQSFDSKRLRREEIEGRAKSESEQLEELQRRWKQERDSEAALGQERIKGERGLAECESQLIVLTRIRETREGFEEGVSSILTEAEREGTTLEGIMGVVAERIKVSVEYELAIEVALGHSLQLLIARSMDEACEAISFLNEKAGASFIPLEDLELRKNVELPKGEGILGNACDFVDYDPTFSKVVRYLLADTYVVSDFSTALDLTSRCAPGVRFATLAGELIVAGGPLKKIGKKRGPSLLVSLNNKIERLRVRVEEMRAVRGKIQESFNEAQEECRCLDVLLSEERERVKRGEIDLAGARDEEVRAALSLDQLEAEREAVAAEAAELETQSRESACREEELEREISYTEKRGCDFQEKSKEVQQNLEIKGTVQERENTSVMELKVLLAEARAKEMSVLESFERVKRETAKAEDALRIKREQRFRSVARRAELAKEIEALKTAVESLLAEKDTNDTDAKEREERKADVYKKQRETDTLLKEEISRLEKNKDEVAGCEVGLARYKAERDTLVCRIREQYEEDLRQVRYDEGIVDWDEVESRIEELKGKLKRIGPVNMVALEEHRELDERLTFLTDQEGDLISAKDSLVEAIDRINVETSRMFTETFIEIRTNFKEIYKELFGGGNADLVLEEGVDILEAGINISARPPGKKLQNISLLSGGEKALTAVALLFAIFKVKPSPFCVLDEIDAPLDESNINRFLKLLEKFLKHSQFIIVTHNKRTISMSDVMYGITMEESGISKVVSVKFGKK